MTTIDARSELTALQANAEVMKNDAERVFEAFEPGDCAAQGDVNLVCLRSLPAGLKPRTNRQVADGATMGSRHIVAEGDVFDGDAKAIAEAIFAATKCRIGPQYIGPVIQGPALLTHPEHGDLRWETPCVVAVVFQRVWDAEQAAERRARD